MPLLNCNRRLLLTGHLIQESVVLFANLQAVFVQGIKKRNGGRLANISADRWCKSHTRVYFGRWKSSVSTFLKRYCLSLHFLISVKFEIVWFFSPETVKWFFFLAAIGIENMGFKEEKHRFRNKGPILLVSFFTCLTHPQKSFQRNDDHLSSFKVITCKTLFKLMLSFSSSLCVYYWECTNVWKKWFRNYFCTYINWPEVYPKWWNLLFGVKHCRLVI